METRLVGRLLLPEMNTSPRLVVHSLRRTGTCHAAIHCWLLILRRLRAALLIDEPLLRGTSYRAAPRHLLLHIPADRESTKHRTPATPQSTGHISSSDDDSCGGNKTKPKKAHKPLGNREAVRKYRQKKKAHTAQLEEEVNKLRAINQQLVKRLQGQAALEAEVCFVGNPGLGVNQSCAPSIVNCNISPDSGQNLVVPHVLSPTDVMGSFMVSSTSKDE
ncbi:hypothetical protein E2562_037670 [Oryza meyeriana var. granulata]|uniref:BZIP domain-containing protein n=1 Tax=Oryza meyeriana var. granulata TaxID=110450 RepID=A0A6G1BQ61_9ORYZ|nr:hypothetical protein E2562_037670 [Oryza meyeriana var. granulata]